MPQDRVLVVDDETMNLMVIEEFLADEGLSLDLQSNALAAWEQLAAPGSHYALVVLDRLMPDLDGLDFLRRMKREPRLEAIPVIMQTAASAPAQIREGLEAGAYYYLTKPYEPEALISIIRAALEDRRSMLKLQAEICTAPATGITPGADYAFATLEDINQLLPALVALCSKPDVVATGLSDLMVNAVEHGNLGITYKEKALLKWEGDWEAEIERRLKLPQFRDRRATVRADYHPGHVVFTISDEGEGFEWEQYLDFDPDRAFDPNGRGIAMARLMSFSALDYQAPGNVVRATALA